MRKSDRFSPQPGDVFRFFSRYCRKPKFHVCIAAEKDGEALFLLIGRKKKTNVEDGDGGAADDPAATVIEEPGVMADTRPVSTPQSEAGDPTSTFLDETNVVVDARLVPTPPCDTKWLEINLRVILGIPLGELKKATCFMPIGTTVAQAIMSGWDREPVKLLHPPDVWEDVSKAMKQIVGPNPQPKERRKLRAFLFMNQRVSGKGGKSARPDRGEASPPSR